MELAGQSVLVLGLGLSGCSAARYCADRGARVTAADERPRDAIRGLADLPSTITLRLGEALPDPADYDIVVPSPGVPAARWQGRAAHAWGDLELCYRALRIPIIAVTGTNGKSTVVRLIEAMAIRAGLRARAAGNLGIPALDLVGAPLDLAILEVSSFQLESVDRFRPRTALWLNLSQDHLDRHADLEGYAAAKLRLFAQQGAGDHAILNADDPIVRDQPLPAGVERLEFSCRGPVASGAWLDGRNAIVRRQSKQRSVSLEGSTISGGHHDANVLASLLALATLDVDLEAASFALAEFEGLPHRCQRVAVRGGVEFVDDSKATNPGAAAQALSSFDVPIVWIVGGRHKGGELASLAAVAQGRVRRALTIGEAAGEFERALSPAIDCERLGSVEAAVRRAAAIASPGDVVLLAPACASFDQFSGFEERGRTFQAAVHALPETRTA